MSTTNTEETPLKEQPEIQKEPTVGEASLPESAEPIPPVSAPASDLPPVPPIPPVNGADTESEAQDEPSSKVYFKKVQVAMPFFVAKKRVEFEVLGSNVGVLVLDSDKDFATVVELNKAAKDKRGGITKIDAGLYDALKKKLTLVPSETRSRRSSIRIFEPQTPFPKPKSPPVPGASASVAAANPISETSPKGEGVGGTAGGSGVPPAPSGFKPATGNKLEPKPGGISRPKPIPPLPVVAPK